MKLSNTFIKTSIIHKRLQALEGKLGIESTGYSSSSVLYRKGLFFPSGNGYGFHAVSEALDKYKGFRDHFSFILEAQIYLVF